MESQEEAGSLGSLNHYLTPQALEPLPSLDADSAQHHLPQSYGGNLANHLETEVSAQGQDLASMEQGAVIGLLSGCGID